MNILNSELKIVRLKGDLAFKNDSVSYFKPVGYCFLHPVLGYFAFANEKTPYSPRGGKKVLSNILEVGGFSDFDNCQWLNPIAI